MPDPLIIPALVIMLLVHLAVGLLPLNARKPPYRSAVGDGER